MNSIQKWLFSLLFLALLSGCQKDDICPEGTATTPLLIIEFIDSEDPTRLKAVQNLEVRAVGMEESYLGPVTTNEISIPLRTDQNSTEYIFTFNSGSDEENEDRVTFSYDPDPEYINRACAYRINYTSLDVVVHGDDNNWILSEIILQENVENETEAHISFTH
jgi:hypothetical protein